MTDSLRSSRLLLLAPLLALTLACGADAERGVDSGDAGDEPVVVEHLYGSTEIDGVPERVVTLDSQWTDTALALGVEPVGYAVDSFMPDGVVPWQDLPEDAATFDQAADLPIEEIAALEPDLIVGSFTILDQRTYELLSGIAPTIAGFDEQQVTPWQDLVELGGQLFERPDEAEALVASVEDGTAAAAADLPELEGQTFALAQYVVGDSLYIVADEADGSSTFFQQFGMVLDPEVTAAGADAGQTRVQVSTERADLLRADVVAFLVNGGDESSLDDIPGFNALPGTVEVLDYPTIVALNTPSVLSIPFALERLVPTLEDAAERAS